MYFNTRRLFSNIAWKETIPFIPPISKGRVIKVYDGDTITVASKLPFTGSPLYRFRVRLARIDAPEIRADCETERKYAIISRDFLSERIINQEVQIRNNKSEKYGRLLAEIYFNDINISDMMMENKMAVYYTGGKKTKCNYN